MASLPHRVDQVVRPHHIALTLPSLWIGTVLRIQAAVGHDLWRDEAQVIDVAQLGSPTVIARWLSAHESHPPLFYFLAKVWGELVGWSDDATHVMPLIVGVALLPLTFLVTRWLYSTAAAVLATWLVALSPTLVIYSGQYRPYILLAGITLIATALVAKGIEKPRRAYFVGYILCMTVALYLHNWMVLVFLAHGVVVLCAIAHRRDGVRRLLPFIGAAAVVSVLWTPWIPSLLQQLSHGGHFAPHISLWDRVRPCLQALFGMQHWAALACVAGLALVLYIRRDILSDRRHWRIMGLAFIGTPMLVITAAIALGPVSFLLVTQGFVALAPLVLVGMAVLIDPGARTAGLISAAVQVAWILGLVYWHGVLRLFPPPTTGATARLVAANRDASDLVLLMSVYSAPSFGRYVGDKSNVRAYPDSTLPRPVEFDHRRERDLDPAALTSTQKAINDAAAAGRRTWYVFQPTSPNHLWATHEQILFLLESAYGKASCRSTVPYWPAAFEWMVWWLFTPRGSPATSCPLEVTAP